MSYFSIKYLVIIMDVIYQIMIITFEKKTKKQSKMLHSFNIYELGQKRSL